jgi:hypothetical protein
VRVVMGLSMLLAGCGNPHEAACERYVDAATTCFSDADAEVPPGVAMFSCADLAEGATYYACVADAYEAGDCASEGAESLNAAVLDCELTP